jgi:hypothetical protein
MVRTRFVLFPCKRPIKTPRAPQRRRDIDAGVIDQHIDPAGVRLPLATAQ